MRFIKDFLNIAWPLHQLTGNQPFVWGGGSTKGLWYPKGKIMFPDNPIPPCQWWLLQDRNWPLPIHHERVLFSTSREGGGPMLTNPSHWTKPEEIMRFMTESFSQSWKLWRTGANICWEPSTRSRSGQTTYSEQQNCLFVSFGSLASHLLNSWSKYDDPEYHRKACISSFKWYVCHVAGTHIDWHVHHHSGDSMWAVLLPMHSGPITLQYWYFV